MEQNIKDIFNEDEWQALKNNEEELIQKVNNLPIHIEVDKDMIGYNHE